MPIREWQIIKRRKKNPLLPHGRSVQCDRERYVWTMIEYIVIRITQPGHQVEHILLLDVQKSLHHLIDKHIPSMVGMDITQTFDQLKLGNEKENSERKLVRTLASIFYSQI